MSRGSVSQGSVSRRPRVLLFDLFGTVVHFAPAVPTVEVAGSRWRSTMGWLREITACELPEVAFEDLLAALMRVTEDIVRRRPPEYREVPSRERFRLALELLGVDAARTPSLAERLSLAHMAHLAAQTRLPAEHREMLEWLKRRWRLGLVSNFDHAPTARRILAEHGVASFFDPILISAEFGRRKPHPAIFVAALAASRARAAEAFYIGDSIEDDVCGARNAGIPMIWVNVKDEALPDGVAPPEHVIRELRELRALLE